MIAQDPVLSSALPPRWGVLVDSKWNRSGGFFSDTLRDPSGHPAVLLAATAMDMDMTRGSLLFHELAHLAHHTHRPHEVSWVREGIALLFERRLSGFHNPTLAEAFREPESSLTAPLDPRDPEHSPDKSGAQYGHILLFFEYIYRLCGGDALLSALMLSPSKDAGIPFLETTLRELAAQPPDKAAISPLCGQGFSAIFRAFEIARFVRDPLVPEGHVLLTSHRSTVREAPRKLPPYSAMAYRLAPEDRCPVGGVAWGRGRCILIRE